MFPQLLLLSMIFYAIFVLSSSRRRANRDNDDNDSSDDDDDMSSLGEEQEVPPLYRSRLETLLTRGTLESSSSSNSPSGSVSLDIDTMHIYYHSEDCQRFYHQMIAYPLEIIPLMDILVQRELERLAVDWDEDTRGPLPRIQVRPYNLRQVSNLRSLDPVAMNSLVSIKGMIVRSSLIIPDLKVAHFGCSICGHKPPSPPRPRLHCPTPRSLRILPYGLVLPTRTQPQHFCRQAIGATAGNTGRSPRRSKHRRPS